MEIKANAATISLEVTKNDRHYTFYIPVGAPFVDAYGVAVECITAINEMAKKAEEEEKNKAAKPEEVDAVPVQTN